MAWSEAPELRTPYGKTWADGLQRHAVFGGTVLHYPSAGPDSEVCDTEVDFTPEHVTAGGRDLWRVTDGEWHYALGLDVTGSLAGLDGTVGFGGRQGEHWLKYRLARVGYLHWPTRDWDDVGGAPTYDRGNLSRQTSAFTLGPEGAEATVTTGLNVVWDGIWSTPGGGDVSYTFRAEGHGLKETIVLNQAAREWVAANRPPATPAAETWFGFVFRLDASDVPAWVRAGVVQDIDGDFDDEGGLEIRNTMSQVLATLPASWALSEPYGEYGDRDLVRLRKRIWLDGDGNHYLLVGARVDQLNTMHAGAIAFDPTLDSREPTVDTYLDSSAPTTRQDGSSWIAVRNFSNGSGTQRRAVAKWDLSSISGTVDSADITFNNQSAFTAVDNYISCHRLTRDVTNAATWNTSDGSTSWTAGGGDFAAATDTREVSAPDRDGAGDDQDFDVQSDVQDFADSVYSNYGWLLQFTGSAVENEDGKWDPRSDATEADRPQIVVVYTLPAGGVLRLVNNTPIIMSLVSGGLAR